ncbi:YggS family pyridoxal phosphate-dependent enzyme [Acidisphaera sp. L21]|uniref:YggS family pyridoxal phosphate-dependent enzyme n=1 Tax=Acidisphaera sp. L21 TaxID=1641851 RepID=UPI00131AE09E|nr:YggS family pyridoxal phosphate-dependent enzyme [Acidisphaera sp. L21]
MSESAALRDRLEHVRETVASAALAAGRRPEDVTLVAVSKTHGAEAVLTVLGAGQLVFGENRVQEAAGKFPGLRPKHPDLSLHLIGPLQTNKVREALAVADVIETLDRPRLADALAAALGRGDTLPQLLVQVNVGEEPQKAGIAPADADGFIQDCQARFGDRLTGLMCIPPAEGDPARHFAWLADRAARHGLAVVSMGMSGDYATAIRHGATHVRVGTAIFGSRPALAAAT